MRIQTDDNFINEVMELQDEFRELEDIQTKINEMLRAQADLMLRMRDLGEQPPSHESLRSAPYVQLLAFMQESMRITVERDFEQFGEFLTNTETPVE